MLLFPEQIEVSTNSVGLLYVFSDLIQVLGVGCNHRHASQGHLFLVALVDFSYVLDDFIQVFFDLVEVDLSLDHVLPQRQEFIAILDHLVPQFLIFDKLLVFVGFGGFVRAGDLVQDILL